jgi:general stress protein 26
MNEKTDIRARVHDILKSFSTAMFVTMSAAGRPESRPMHVARVDDQPGSDIWFFTAKGGTLAEEIKETAVVLLVFQNENTAYLSLRGKARIVQDLARIQELWKEPYRVWFPRGPQDPEIALVAVNPIDAEYWDNRGMNKLEYLFEAAKAYVKGEKPEIAGVDQHAKTNL